MNFKAYLDYFKAILDNPNPPAPYDNADYIDYARLNWNRMHRWLKKGEIKKELKEIVTDIREEQHWLIITEPWCGDAAHLVPFFEVIAELNPLIKTEYELRDSEPFTINQYLTDGKSKSIPILVVRNKSDGDLFHWGPRPAEAQKLHKELNARNADFEEEKVTLQKWYNKDKGKMLQDELLALLKQ